MDHNFIHQKLILESYYAPFSVLYYPKTTCRFLISSGKKEKNRVYPFTKRFSRKLNAMLFPFFLSDSFVETTPCRKLSNTIKRVTTCESHFTNGDSDHHQRATATRELGTKMDETAAFRQRDRRPEALGSLSVLPDETICVLLEYLAPRDIAHLACVSRFSF